MIYRLLFLATLLGIANAAESCYYCDNTVTASKCSDGAVVKTCDAQTGQASCLNVWTNQDIISQGCSGDQVPADAVQCGAAFKCKSERSGMKCWCTSENCNKNTTMPTIANCQQANPENGADGKVGAVFSIVLSAIFATIF